MRTITMAAMALGVLGVVASAAPAYAHDGDHDGGWHRQEWREHQWREHEWHEHAWRGYAPPPVYVAPGYYAAPQSYYARRRPTMCLRPRPSMRRPAFR